MTSSEICNFLTQFSYPYPETDDPNEYEEAIQKVEDGCFEFLRTTGYEPEDIYQDVTLPLPEPDDEFIELPDEFEPNFIIGKSPASTPYVVADAYLGTEAEITPYYRAIRPQGLVADYIKYIEYTKCHYFVVFSNEFIVVSRPTGRVTAYAYEELDESDAGEIGQALDPPDSYPGGSVHPAAFHPHQTKLLDFEIPPFPNTPSSQTVLESEQFSIDLKEYSDALRKAKHAVKPIEKGKSLEKVAKSLFQGIRCVTVKDTNVETRSGEIDLIVEYVGADEQTLFDYHGRYILLECKNWVDPVPAKELGHFETKLSKTGTKLGVVFAWSGISGEGDNLHAERLIDTARKDRPVILVIDERDLFRIAEGKSFYRILDDMLYRKRFDL